MSSITFDDSDGTSVPGVDECRRAMWSRGRFCSGCYRSDCYRQGWSQKAVRKDMINLGADVETERRSNTDRRRELTIPEIAARGTHGIIAVTQRFAANMTMAAFLTTICIGVGGSAVAFWSPLFHDDGPSSAPAIQRQNERDRLTELERKQDHDTVVGEAHDSDQDRAIAEVKDIALENRRIATENQVIMVEMRQFMSIVYTGLGAIGALLGGVLVGVLTLLIQRWLKIKV